MPACYRVNFATGLLHSNKVPLFGCLIHGGWLPAATISASVVYPSRAEAEQRLQRTPGELYGSMEAYFSRRGNPDNDVKVAREGRELAATVVRSVAANDFATASKAAVSIARACRACHWDYKPLD